MKTIVKIGAAAVALTVAGSANAQLTTYIGADDNVNSLAQMTDSVAAAGNWAAAVGSSSVIDFESALPSGVTIAGGTTTNNSGCGPLCGFNTTTGGENFRLLVGGSTTFSFANGVNSFGFYVTGLQTDLVGQQTVTFNDGSQQVINFPAAVQGSNGGGGAFIGFTDFGRSIASVSIDVSNDIVAIDDVRFAAVPEPAAWAMMIAGFGLVGAASRRRTTKVSFA